MEIKDNTLILIILAFIVGYCLPQLMNNMCGGRQVRYFEPSAGKDIGIGGGLLLAGKGVVELVGGGATDTAAVAAAPEGGVLGPSEVLGVVGTGMMVDGGSDVAIGSTAIGDSVLSAGSNTLDMMAGMFGE